MSHKKVVILASDEVPALISILSQGTPNLVSIDRSSATAEDIHEIQLRNEKRFRAKLSTGEDNPEFDRAEFETWIFKKVKQRALKAIADGTELIIISEKGLLPADFQEIKKDLEYNIKYEILQIISCDCDAVHEEPKKAFFISGDQFECLAQLLIKGDAVHSKTISDPDIKIMDRKYKSESANAENNLLIVNVENFTIKDDEYYRRMSGTEGFALKRIRLPLTQKTKPEEDHPTSEKNAVPQKINASELKQKLKKTKWFIVSWETFLRELKEEALEKDYLREDQEIVDDLS